MRNINEYIHRYTNYPNIKKTRKVAPGINTAVSPRPRERAPAKRSRAKISPISIYQ